MMNASDKLLMALYHVDFGELTEGKRALEETVQLAEKHGDQPTLVSALCCLGEVCSYLQENDLAVKMLKRCLSIHSAVDEVQTTHQTARLILNQLRR